MTYVFVSRPTWVAPNFEKGLASFLRLLENMKLKPRTLGAGGDYPSKSPLDEVIALMNECPGEGAGRGPGRVPVTYSEMRQAGVAMR
jgi:hypothetical protein